MSKEKLLELSKQIDTLEKLDFPWDLSSNDEITIPGWLADELRPAFEKLLEQKRAELDTYEVTQSGSSDD